MAAGGSGNQQGISGRDLGSKPGNGYFGGNAGGFGAMGSPSAANYQKPVAPMAPKPVAPKPFQPMMPQMMPGQFLGVGGQGLPAYGAQVPGFSFFGPSYGGAVPGGMFPGLMAGLMRGIPRRG